VVGRAACAVAADLKSGRGDEGFLEVLAEQHPVIAVPGLGHPAIISIGDADMVENQHCISFSVFAESQVHRGEMSSRESPVRPSENDALVLYDVEEITGVVLVAHPFAYGTATH